jgi:hypothetical protein
MRGKKGLHSGLNANRRLMFPHIGVCTHESVLTRPVLGTFHVGKCTEAKILSTISSGVTLSTSTVTSATSA